jgi:hypothetical protein
MRQDVSKLTVLVLLVLTILVSVLGALTVINAMSSPLVPASDEVVGSPAAAGFISINIAKPEEPTAGEVRIQIANEVE